DGYRCLEDPRLGQTDPDPGLSHAAFSPRRRQPRLKHSLQRRLDRFSVALLEVASDLPAAKGRGGYDAHGKLLLIDDQADRRPVAQPFPGRSHRQDRLQQGAKAEMETTAGDRTGPPPCVVTPRSVPAEI